MPNTFDNGSWTSEVADQMATSLKPKVREEILTFFAKAKQKGATDQEIEFAITRPGNTVRPGRVALVKEGLVIDSGKWRFTESHRPAIVWILSEYSDS